jgi:hypothetical protein
MPSFRSEEDWMSRRIARLSIAVLIAAGVFPGGVAFAGTCPVPLPRGGDPVDLDPADFVDTIDNPFLPLLQGSVWRYRETDPEGARMRVKVSVTSRTRPILGIDATVVHDKVTERGDLVENTFDWYAQDVCGNVWYMGENTKEYENGVVVSTEGSWEAGVDGAQPGVVMPADPQVGQAYRQEFYAGQAEDRAEIASLDEQAQVPAGHFRPVIMTKDTTPLHPRVLEYKFYAEGIGVVLAVGISGGADREELLRFTPGSD